MTGYRQQKPRFGLTKCPDLVDHYTREQQAQIVAFMAELPQRQLLKPRPQMQEWVLELESEVFNAGA